MFLWAVTEMLLLEIRMPINSYLFNIVEAFISKPDMQNTGLLAQSSCIYTQYLSVTYLTPGEYEARQSPASAANCVW